MLDIILMSIGAAILLLYIIDILVTQPVIEFKKQELYKLVDKTTYSREDKELLKAIIKTYRNFSELILMERGLRRKINDNS